MASLSLCMIVKNEEDVLGRCLECAKSFADEIIIVDTGSTDSTKEIAKKYTENVYDFMWIDDFSAARNFSFSKATKDYIMWLDADDVIDEKNQKELELLKKTLDELAVDVVMMKYHIAFDEEGNPTFSYYRERILNKKMNFQWVGEIHEVITPKGNVINSEIAINHKKMHANEPQRNLRIFEQMIKQGKSFEPRQKYYYARELYYNGFYEKAIAKFEEFLLENQGWVENNISACKDLAVCYEKAGGIDKKLPALFKSLEYDVPRAEICCDIGKHFMGKGQYKIAVFWYELALNSPIDDSKGSFLLLDCYGYIPYMQLCVCYDKLGLREKAIEYNELAGKQRPKDKGYLYNKKYFES